eukprot:TRINITY_DN2266_c0_g1_i10.p1 TRINITY_DN2266_c0_g1~~TRINITY_DN2266_c0_g1_i10.p1  ORF type:complete len:564 (-),score=80.87 TRINITY_DN2266_c0_g1_i10:32-1624(-)
MAGSILFMYNKVVSELRQRCKHVPRHFGRRFLCPTILLAVIVAGLALAVPRYFGYGSRRGTCRGLTGSSSRQAALVGEVGPANMLSLAKQKSSPQSWSEESLSDLKRCIAWQPRPGSVAAFSERKAQLACHAALVQSNRANKFALSEHIRGLMSTVEATSQRCDSVQVSLNSRRMQAAAGKGPANSLEALTPWAALEENMRDAIDTLDTLDKLLETIQQSTAGVDLGIDKAMDRVPHLRDTLKRCALRGSREARLMAALTKPSSAVEQKEHCLAPKLLDMECLALADHPKPVSEHAFDKGLLLSEVAMGSASTPFFRGSVECCEVCRNSSLDTQGYDVPSGIVVAEELLTRGFESSQAHQRTERAVMRSMQLSKHGEYLAKSSVEDGALTWRYESAANLAAANGRDKLAAGTMAKLSSVLSKRGNVQDALEAANRAMTWSDDPLASYQQVRLRVETWTLKSGVEVEAAARQVLDIPRGVLSKKDDKARLALGMQLLGLHSAVESPSVSACFSLGDAAHVLACTFGKLFYA